MGGLQASLEARTCLIKIGTAILGELHYKYIVFAEFLISVTWTNTGKLWTNCLTYKMYSQTSHRQKHYYRPVDRTMRGIGWQQFSTAEHSAGSETVSHSAPRRIYRVFQCTFSDHNYLWASTLVRVLTCISVHQFALIAFAATHKVRHLCVFQTLVLRRGTENT